MSKIRIQHFSDVLCVWAWVSHARIEELKRGFGDQIELEFHFIQVFGNNRDRLERQWKDRGGAEGYANHVRRIASGFDHVKVHPELWTHDVPASSMPAHLFLCAVRAEAPDELERTAGELRRAFFEDGANLARTEVLSEIGHRLELPMDRIDRALALGDAHAALSLDLVLARDSDVRISPTLVFNEGRQRLTGNVGYRVIEANLRELLRRPDQQQSWC